MPDPLPESPLRFTRICDASAALQVGRHLVVANDEDDRLRVYDVERAGAPIEQIDLAPHLSHPEPDREADLEAVAVLDGVAWWIGSHSRSRKGAKRPNRRILVATKIEASGERLAVEVLGHHHGSRSKGLLGAILALPGIGPILKEAEKRAPKEDAGFNIEGLAAHRGGLLIGLRSPLVDGRAPVVRLPDPMALLRDGEPGELSGFTIDLGGRGIRSMSDIEGRGELVIVAGGVASEGDFALFRWSGEPDDAPVPLAVELGDLRVESIVPMSDGRLLVLSDDGAVEHDGVACKDRPAAERGFRAQWIALP